MRGSPVNNSKMATWRCTFTEVIRSLQFGDRVTVTPDTCIYIYTRHGESLRVDVPRDLSPADPVQKLKDGETENCIRRLTRAVPGGSPGTGTSRRNSKFKFKYTRDVLSFFLSDLAPLPPPWNWYIVLIYGEFGARTNTSMPINMYARVCRWPCGKSSYVSAPILGMLWNFHQEKRKREKESEKETRCNLIIF